MKRITALKRPCMRVFMASLLSSFLLGGCGGIIPPKPTAAPTLYSLDMRPSMPSVPSVPPAATSSTRAHPPALRSPAPTLVVSIPQAASGFDTSRIIYIRQPHKLDYFAHSQWVDTPSTMLLPLITRTLEQQSAFSAVVRAPTSAAGKLRLDVEIIRLQHEFISQPSQVHFTLRAHLMDATTRQIVAGREFNARVPAATEDPYGGVVAANQAVQNVLAELAVFCSEAAQKIQKEKTQSVF